MMPAPDELDEDGAPCVLPSQLRLEDFGERALAALSQQGRMQLARKCLYLRGLSARGVARDGLAAAGGVSYTTLSAWRRADPWFQRMELEATLEARDNLEAEAYRRAVTGVDEPVVYQGMVTTVFDSATGQDKVLTVKRYSDSLLQMLLRAADPEKYRERASVDVQHGGAVGVLVVPATEGSVADWEKVASAQQARFAGNVGERATPALIEGKRA